MKAALITLATHAVDGDIELDGIPDMHQKIGTDES